MKKRINKKYFIIFVSIALVFITTLGYASISNIQLTILGNAFVSGVKSEDDFIVEFTSVANITPTQPNDITVVANIDSVNKRSASFSVSGLVGYGDSATVKYEVTNNSEYHSAIVSSTIDNDNSTYFSVEKSFIDTNGDPITILDPGESALLVIKANVIKVTTTAAQTANVTVTLTTESTPYTGE